MPPVCTNAQLQPAAAQVNHRRPGPVRGEILRVEGVQHELALLPIVHQAGVPQHAQVVGNVGDLDV